MSFLSSLRAGLTGAAWICLHCLSPWLSNWRTHWGASKFELALALPGDELVPYRQWSSTHAIAVRTLPEAIWPWLVQIGQDRGGFYSYTFLENLLGCQISNTDHILPQFQKLNPGEGIRLHPQVPPLPVQACVKNHYLLLFSEIDVFTGSPPISHEIPAKRLVKNSWLFHLLPQADGSTRLLTRGHYAYAATLPNLLLGRLLLEPISFVMERKMLKEIKRLAEGR